MADNIIHRQEVSALMKIQKGLDLQSNKKSGESGQCLAEGEEELQQVIENLTDVCKLPKHQADLQECLDGPENPKEFLPAEWEASRKVEKIEIEEDSVGYSYETLFGRYLNKYVTQVDVFDPYIREDHQIKNFVRLCELIVRKKTKVTTITLTTGNAKKIPMTTVTLTSGKATGNVKRKDFNSHEQQNEKLQSIGQSLALRNIQLQINYSDTLHDREIRLSTGWVINIGRGLDYFKNEEGFKLGLCDLDLRPCRKTTVHIYNKDSVKLSPSTS